MLLLVPIFKGIGLVVLLFIVNPLLIDVLFIRKSKAGVKQLKDIIKATLR